MYQILIVAVYVIVLNMILLCILPLVLLAVLNTLVYLKLKEFSQCIEMHVRSESLQMKELKLAMVSCLIVAGEQDMFRVQLIYVIQSSSSATALGGSLTCTSSANQ